MSNNNNTRLGSKLSRSGNHNRTFDLHDLDRRQARLTSHSEEEEECEVDDDFLYSSGLLTPLDGSIPGEGVYEEVEGEFVDGASRGSIEGQSKISSGGRTDSLASENSGSTPEGQRAEPLGAHTQGPLDPALTEAKKLVMANRAPERLFKVVFVGDSGVGKTSIIHRFCTDSFTDSFSATIGVDFQVKSLTIFGNIVAMQLWDTAGQERFRSITRHYFRKADGIVVLYDVTSESSFVNVRNWMTSVEETTDDHVVKMLLGNKCDRVEEKEIKEEVGHSLAESYDCDFYEVSAKSGYNVVEAFTAMSKLLLMKEDEEIQNSLNLVDMDMDRKRCCDS